MMTDQIRPPHRRTLRVGGMALLLMAGVLGAALPSVAGAVPADDIGVLFYSPAERTAIERARSGTEAAAQETPASLQVTGLVRRGSGKSTAWINNRPWPEGPLNVARHAATVGAGGVSVDGRPLRIGETLDLTTGQRSDFIAAEAVRIRPSR